MSRWKWAGGVVLCLHPFIAHAAGQDLFVLRTDGTLFRGDLQSEALDEIGDIGLDPTGLISDYARDIEFTSDGRMLAMGQDAQGTVFVIDLETRTATPFVRPADQFPGVFAAVTATSSRAGLLYVTTALPHGIFVYDELTGAYIESEDVAFVDEHPPGGIGFIWAIVERDDGRLVFVTRPPPGHGCCSETSYVFWELDTRAWTVEPLPHEPIPVGSTSGVYMCVYRGDTFFIRVTRLESGGVRLRIDVIDPYTGVLNELQTIEMPFNIVGFQIVPENPADRALPHGELDVSDAVTFLVSFSKGEAEADLAAPYGVHDYEDVIGFLRAFERGYP